MRYKFLLVHLMAMALFSCKKENGPIMPPVIPNPDPGARSVLLKDIQIPNLPSPYYYFEYDNEGKVKFASFASDFNRYQVKYAGGRISEMRNDIIVNKDILQYLYDPQGRIAAINYGDSLAKLYTRLVMFYDGQKLIKLERWRKSGTGFVKDKELIMTYHPDGNLNELTYHYFPVNGMIEQIYTDRFEQYDNKINVDGFGLIHNEFFDHFVLLPGIVLQKNNPGKETRTGNAENYTVDYSYTFDNLNRPLNKKGNLLLITGSNAGRRFETNSFYSYY